MGEMFEENKLMLVNNNELELTKDGIKFIKKMQKAKIELAKMEEQLKENFKEIFEETGTNKFISEDGTFKATYIEETTTKRFDSKKFKAEHEDLYNKYQTTSKRSAYVKFN